MKEIRAWKRKTNCWSIRWLIECLLLLQSSPELCPTSRAQTRLNPHFQARKLSSSAPSDLLSVWSGEVLVLRTFALLLESRPALPGALLVLCNLRTRSALLNVLLPNLFNSEFIMMHLISTFVNRTRCSELVLHLEKCSFTRNQT